MQHELGSGSSRYRRYVSRMSRTENFLSQNRPPTDLRPTSDRRSTGARPAPDRPPTNLRPTSDQPPTNLRPTSDQPPTGVHLPPTDLRPTSDRRPTDQPCLGYDPTQPSGRNIISHAPARAIYNMSSRAPARGEYDMYYIHKRAFFTKQINVKDFRKCTRKSCCFWCKM